MKVQDFDPRDYLRLNQFPHFSVPAADTVSLSVHWFGRFTNWNSPWTKWPSSQGSAVPALTAYIDSNTFHVTHGRPIAFATGIALTRPDLKVVVITGDGDCLAIGGNHLIHACRRNLEMTCLMLNNEVYGMTGGQVSPTTTELRFTPTTPEGNIEPVFDACELARSAGAGMVGREVTLQTPALKNLIWEALQHKGFSFVEVISDCTEIYGRKNDLGSSPEMILSQKSSIRPDSYGNVVDVPFRPNFLQTGILSENERPEYGEAYRGRILKQAPAEQSSSK